MVLQSNIISIIISIIWCKQVHLQALLPLEPPDELAHFGHQHIHRRHSPAIIVGAHVERLDALRVVLHDDRLLEHLLC